MLVLAVVAAALTAPSRRAILTILATSEVAMAATAATD
jgi:hypothetical protein